MSLSQTLRITMYKKNIRNIEKMAQDNDEYRNWNRRKQRSTITIL